MPHHAASYQGQAHTEFTHATHTNRPPSQSNCNKPGAPATDQHTPDLKIYYFY